MSHFSLWNNGRRGDDYLFIDGVISEYFEVSGTALYLHKYLGGHDQTVADPSNPTPPAAPSVTSIQDVLFLENRDRKYSPDVIEMSTIYQINDVDANMLQFGLFLTGDTLFLEVHYNDMIARVGRKIMTGDVVELPHRRDLDLLDPSSKAINKFFVVSDTSFSASGYSATWFAHIWRLKVEPMTDSQEYTDILDAQSKNPLGLDNGILRDSISTIGTDLGINEAVVEAARLSVTKRNFETRQFYVMPGDETTRQNPWVYAGDGIPPNGVPAQSGTDFPVEAEEGDYYLRTDYKPHTLYRKIGNKWRMQELAYREELTAASRILLDFFNERGTETFDDGHSDTIRKALSRATKPRADF